MASRRRSWDSLTPAYRGRLSRGGITKSAYESGASIKKARGHGQTPEHGIREALRHPEKYKSYIKRKNIPPAAPTPEQEAVKINNMLDRAFRSMQRFGPSGPHGEYLKYYEPTVEANVYGVITRESGEVEGMSYAQATWTANADMEEIRSMAREQYRGNPWWYH